jgi:hypothetical protein
MPRKRALQEDEDANRIELGQEFKDTQCLLISEVKGNNCASLGERPNNSYINDPPFSLLPILLIKVLLESHKAAKTAKGEEVQEYFGPFFKIELFRKHWIIALASRS